MLARDLARICPACLLDSQFPETLLFGQAQIYMKNFQFRIFEGNNQKFFLTNHLDMAEVEILELLFWTDIFEILAKTLSQ